MLRHDGAYPVGEVGVGLFVGVCGVEGGNGFVRGGESGCRPEGARSIASFKFGTDVDEVGLDLGPVKWSTSACHDGLRCSAEARIQTL